MHIPYIDYGNIIIAAIMISSITYVLSKFISFFSKTKLNENILGNIAIFTVFMTVLFIGYNLLAAKYSNHFYYKTQDNFLVFFYKGKEYASYNAKTCSVDNFQQDDKKAILEISCENGLSYKYINGEEIKLGKVLKDKIDELIENKINKLVDTLNNIPEEQSY